MRRVISLVVAVWLGAWLRYECKLARKRSELIEMRQRYSEDFCER